MGGQILSMLAVPLWRGDDIIGLIQADNRVSAGMFHERDLEVVLLLGAQAALAVDNATLVQRLRVTPRSARGENVVPQAPRAEDQVRQHHRRLAGDEGGARPARARDRHPRDGVHRGRDRHRQGADRERDPLPVAAARQDVRRAELRGAAREPARERAVRPQARRVHQRRQRQEGPVRDRRRRHAVPRRDGRDADVAAGQAAARAAGRHDPPGRRDQREAGRRPHHLRDEPRPRRRGREGPVPPGPLLPADGVPDQAAAAARAPRGHPRARRALPQALRRGVPRRASGVHPGRARRARVATTGPATSASSRTRSSAS